MGIGLLELVVIAVVALVLLGPQRLPEVLQQLGKFYVQLRRTSTDVRGAFEDVVRKAEEEVRLDEIKRLTELSSSPPAARSESAADVWHSGPATIVVPQPKNDELNKDHNPLL